MKRDNIRTLRLVAYTRVSTEEQALHGVSLKAQSMRILAYAKAHDFNVVATVSDAGVSGKVPPAKRPGLSCAMQMIESGKADGVVFLKLDRLSRSVRDLLKMADDARRKNWHLLSVSENLDTSTASGKFMLGVLGLLAEMERDQISERTVLGMAQLAAENRARSHRLPFGYRLSGLTNSTTVPQSSHRRLVTYATEMRILERMLSLQRNGFGARRIASELNGSELINPRTQLPWHPSTVAAILRTASRRKHLAIATETRPERNKTRRRVKRGPL